MHQLIHLAFICHQPYRSDIAADFHLAGLRCHSLPVSCALNNLIHIQRHFVKAVAAFQIGYFYNVIYHIKQVFGVVFNDTHKILHIFSFGQAVGYKLAVAQDTGKGGFQLVGDIVGKLPAVFLIFHLLCYIQHYQYNTCIAGVIVGAGYKLIPHVLHFKHTMGNMAAHAPAYSLLKLRHPDRFIKIAVAVRKGKYLLCFAVGLYYVIPAVTHDYTFLYVQENTLQFQLFLRKALQLSADYIILFFDFVYKMGQLVIDIPFACFYVVLFNIFNYAPCGDR